MAISGTTEWDVRVSGSDSNGGSFDPTLGGTDYSQQDTPQVTYTDLVIGATTTQLTSSANPFTSAHVGNVINITGGTGFTTGRYQVASVASNVATMDRSVGTAASTGGTGNLGGALANVATAIASFGNAGNTVHVKAGTYTYTSNQSWTPTNFGFNAFSIIGYGTTHLDGGTKPLITTATNSTNLISVGAVNGGVLLISNISFSNTAGTKGTGISATSGLSPAAYFADCTVDGFSTAIAYTGSQFIQITLRRCEFKNCTTGITQTSPLYVFDSNLHNNGWAIISSNNAGDNILDASGSIFASNTNGGIALNNGGQDLRINRCTFYGNATGAIANISSATPNEISVQNTIFYGNGWGININTALGAKQTALSRNNAFGSNSSGDVHNYTKSSTDVTLTANPFTNTASGDYSLNATAGGGALLKGAGYPGTFPGGTTTATTDIGAAQSGSGGGSSVRGMLVHPGLSGGARG